MHSNMLRMIIGMAVTAATPLHAAAPAKIQAEEPVFITLGTGGGPAIRLERSQPANAVVVNGAIYLFDVGDGVQRQMAAAKLPVAKVRAIFISHHHLDHNGGLSALVVNRWLVSGNYAPLPVIGPPGTEMLVTSIGQGYQATEWAPITIGGPPKPKIAATLAAKDLPAEINTPEMIYQDENIRVLAVVNDHYHFSSGSVEERNARSYSYRIETEDKSYVFTGDTGPSERTVLLAKDADVLVSEVIDLEQQTKFLRSVKLPEPFVTGLLKHLEQDHLTPAEVGKMAQRARVKEVVLTHLVPGNDGEKDLSGYVEGLNASFKGPVHIAKDLDRF